MLLIFLIVIFFILLFFSAFFSGSETALFSLSKARIMAWEKDALPGRKRAAFLMNSYNKTLIALVLGNMFVNIGISLIGDEIFNYLHLPLWLKTVLSMCSVIILLLIIGEITPKTLALLYREKFSEKVSGFVMLMRIVFLPLITILEKSFAFALDMLGRKQSAPLSPDEYSAYIEMANSIGAFSSRETHLLAGVFSLREKQVALVMKPRVDIKIVSQKDSEEEINRTIQSIKEIYIPVVEEDLDDAEKFLSARDFYLTPQPQRKNWLKYATFKVHFIPEHTTLTKALREMKKHKIPIALVVDEFGGVVGDIRIKDIYKEIFGNIAEEFETPDWQVKKVSDTKWVFSGQMTLSDIEKITKVKFPDNSLNTLNALFYEKLEKVPEKGYVININNMKIRALKVKNNRIVEVELSLMNKMEGK